MIWNENDANPMHRRIPGEVVMRRARPEPKGEQKVNEDEVAVDLKAAVGLKPEARPKWLGKAIAMVENGKVSATDLFDVVTNRKFVSGLPDRVLRKITAIILDCQNVFSEKQRRYLLSSECVLIREPAVVPVSKVEAEPEDKKDDALAAIAADRALEQALKAAPARPVPERPTPPARERPAAPAMQWEVAQDESASRRQAREAKEMAARASGREEKRRREALFEDLVREDPQARVQAQRRKLEEDVDALFSRAFGQRAVSEQDGGRGSAGREEKRRKRDRASRSISSRAARRTARAEREKKASGRGDWRRGGDVATGSRAIFMHKDFQEDLPHMPRPSQPGTAGRQRLERSPSRSRGGHGSRSPRRRSL